jgi:hypothetical protein
MVPVLPTTVMGSCSVPQWLERLKTDYDHNRARIPGVQIPVTVKSFYYDYYDTVVTEPLPTTVGCVTFPLMSPDRSWPRW